MSKIFKTIVKVIGVIVPAIRGLGLIAQIVAVGASTAVSVHDARQAKKDSRRARRAQEAQSQTFMVRRAIVPRRIVYGRTRVGGIWVYVDTTDNNKYLHVVLALCEGPVKSIDEVWLSDEAATLDANGDGTGKWAGKLRVKKYLGAASQTADPDLVSESAEWTTDHKLEGIAYIYVRLQFDRAVYPNGMPSISATVTGRSDIKDGRDDSFAYSSNPALCLAHYLSLSRLGPGVDWDTEIDHPAFDAAANVCDEQVAVVAASGFTVSTASDTTIFTSADHGLFNGQIVNFVTTGTLPDPLAPATDYFVVGADSDTFKVSAELDGDPVEMTNNGTGSHTFTATERRYTVNGVVNLDDSPEDIISVFRESMAGTVAYIGGKWTMVAGAYQTPTYTIDEGVLVGPVEFTPKISRQDRFNTVKGFILTHRNRWQAADYPAVSDASYVSEDGEEIILGLDLPAVSTPSAAQRIAKIFLEKSRLERTLQLTCNMEAIRARAGGTVLVNLPRFGLSNVPFDVASFNLDTAGGQVVVSLTLRETHADVFNWVPATHEGAFEVPNEPELADGSVAAPTGMNAVNVAGGRQAVGVDLTWSQSVDEFVLNGGFVVVQWKRSNAVGWLHSVTLSGDSTSHTSDFLEPLRDYDFRIAFRNALGGQSEWTSITDHTTAPNNQSAFSFKYEEATPKLIHTIVHNLGYRPGTIAVFHHTTGDPILAFSSTGSALHPDPTGNIAIDIEFNVAIPIIAYLS